MNSKHGIDTSGDAYKPEGQTNTFGALELLKHRLGDHSGVHNHKYGEPQEYVPPQSKGRIITLNE
jgi:hypothetical protein